MRAPIIWVGILVLPMLVMALSSLRIAKRHQRRILSRFPIPSEVMTALKAAPGAMKAVSARGNGPATTTAIIELGAPSRSLTSDQPPDGPERNRFTPVRRLARLPALTGTATDPKEG
jgi:hypothetical protein